MEYFPQVLSFRVPNPPEWMSTFENVRVTSLEQLSIAEFSSESTPKVYENGHKRFYIGIWFDLVLKVKYSKILIFKGIFLCKKAAESLQFFH